MRYNKVCVEAFGYEIPDTVVTSQNLEERVAPVYEKLNLSYGRFELMTGIRERRFWADETSPSQASTKAAEKAIAKSGIEKTDIECLLHTSVCRDFLEPATATLVPRLHQRHYNPGKYDRTGPGKSRHCGGHGGREATY